MATLAAFLGALDLDELVRIKRSMSPLTPNEAAEVESLLRAWSNIQAIANLLFHPQLIPAPLRFEVIDRALHSYDQPYLALAAIVGLQQVDPEAVPASNRMEWSKVLLSMIRSPSILAGRASATMFAHLPDADADELLSLYPVRNETASKNIVAFALARFGELSPDRFAQRMASAVTAEQLPVFEEAHKEYRRRQSRGDDSTSLLTSPSYCYIPNLSQIRWAR